MIQKSEEVKDKAEGAALVAGGTAAGAGASAVVGGMGLVGGFGGVAIGMAPVAAAGAVVGSAAYGAKKAIEEGEWIKEVNNQTTDKPKKSKTRKAGVVKPKNQPSRYIPVFVRVSVLQRNKYKCFFCGRSAKQIQLEVDHIILFLKVVVTTSAIYKHFVSNAT